MRLNRSQKAWGVKMTIPNSGKLMAAPTGVSRRRVWLSIHVAVGVEYTIDQLAREAGTTVRSLRVYHERGILQPPQVKGRTGFYGPEHLVRVQTITRLLDRGIKLNGIRELLDALDRGEGLADVLGVADVQTASVAGRSTGDTVKAADLEKRYGDIPNGLSRVVAVGLYEPVDATTYRLTDPMLSRIIDRLVATGIPEVDVFDELENLRFDCDRIARRAVDLFDRTLLRRFQRSEQTADDNATLANQLAAARIIPGQVAAELVNRYVVRYLEHATAELTERRIPK
jgi:DNA-binding transcriptional MerR regulator